jgi:hypothetical protein
MKDRIEELAKQFKLIPSYFEDSEFPDDLLKFAQAIHNEALELAAKECSSRTEGFASKSTWDYAVLDCAKAIRKLKV